MASARTRAEAEAALKQRRDLLVAKREVPGVENRMSRRISWMLDEVIDVDGKVTDRARAIAYLADWETRAAETAALVRPLYAAAAAELRALIELDGAPGPNVR